MHTVLECTKDITEYFNKWLGYFMLREDLYADENYSSLSNDCFATTNLLGLVKDNVFDEYIGYLKDICEASINRNLSYQYLQKISYDAGGYMTRHSHEHNEDLSFILYLNTCKDGATVLHDDYEDHYITPKQNSILVFSADTEHSAKFSDSKRILVGGLKLKNYEERNPC